MCIYIERETRVQNAVNMCHRECRWSTLLTKQHWFKEELCLNFVSLNVLQQWLFPVFI